MCRGAGGDIAAVLIRAGQLLRRKLVQTHRRSKHPESPWLLHRSGDVCQQEEILGITAAFLWLKANLSLLPFINLTAAAIYGGDCSYFTYCNVYFRLELEGECVLLYEERQREFNEWVDLNSKTQTQTLVACHCVLFYRHFNVVHIIKSGLIAFILYVIVLLQGAVSVFFCFFFKCNLHRTPSCYRLNLIHNIMAS